MKYISATIIIFSLFFFYVTECFAASISITGGQTSITANDEYSVSVTLSINNDTDYYLRGVFHKPNTDNYCGYTWNGSSWFNGPYSNGGWTNFLKITTKNNIWNGQLKAKMDPTDNACNAGGTYNFKIERFTQWGTENSDIQTEQTVQVITPSISADSLTSTSIPASELTPNVSTISTSSTPGPTLLDPSPTIDNSGNNSDSVSTSSPISPTPTVTPQLPTASSTTMPTAESQLVEISPTSADSSTVSAKTTVISPTGNESVLGLQFEPTSTGLSNDNPELPAKKGIASGIWYLLFMGAVLLMAGCGIVLFQIKKRKNL